MPSLAPPSGAVVSSWTQMNSRRPESEKASASGPSGPPSRLIHGISAVMSWRVIVWTSVWLMSLTSTLSSYESAAAYHPDNAAAPTAAVSSGPLTTHGEV